MDQNNSSTQQNSTFQQIYLKLSPSFYKYYEYNDPGRNNNSSLPEITESDIEDLFQNSVSFIQNEYPGFYAQMHNSNKKNMFIQDYINTREKEKEDLFDEPEDSLSESDDIDPENESGSEESSEEFSNESSSDDGSSDGFSE
jgi:hypothetical protein